MIRKLLEAFEAGRSQVLLRGLDAAGEPAWECTGEDLLQRVAAWQGWLRRQGARPGDRVALALPRGPDLLPAHVAVLASGETVVPLDPTLPPAERARILERAAPRAILERVGSGAPAPRGPGAGQALHPHPDGAPALLIFTSGTTGEPKGVPHLEPSLEANLAGLAQVWQLSAHDRLLHALPAHHVHGLVLALYGSARLGIPIVMLERFDAQACLRALARWEITLFMGVPTMYHRMLESAQLPELPQLRLCVSGSAPLAARDFSEWRHRFGEPPLERYGLSETLICTSNRLQARRPGCVGWPLPKTEVRLADDGEVEVRGPGVMAGYWNAPERTATAFRDGFFRTGDLGRLESDGALVLTGRKKDLILVGGSNVIPGEVERALQGDPGVDELAVAGVPDADRGELVGAFVIARPDAEPIALEARLRARASEGLARYKQPRLYRFVDSLPRNAMGKVDRRALARQEDRNP